MAGGDSSALLGSLSVGTGVPLREPRCSLRAMAGGGALDRGAGLAPAARAFHGGRVSEEFVSLLLDGIAAQRVDVRIGLHDAPARSRPFLIGRTLVLSAPA